MRYPTPARWRISPIDHDGDTLETEVDCGGINEKREKWSIRLQGVFAPELAQTGGPECRAFVIAWLADNGDGSEWPFLLETFRTPRADRDVQTLGRYVGRVTAANGRCLNDDVQAFVTANGYPGGIGS